MAQQTTVTLAVGVCSPDEAHFDYVVASLGLQLVTVEI